jgi:vesicle transport through interaction with t-SNAREs protein 1
MSCSSISQFEAYYEEYVSLMEQINNNPTGEPESLLQACHDLVQQMRIEARGCDDVAIRQELLDRVKMYSSTIQALQQRTARDTLLGSKTGTTASVVERLEQSALTRQNDTLDRALASMQETEEVGLEVIQELGRNRETMHEAHDKTRQVSTLTDSANALLKSMNAKWWQPSFYKN